MTWRRGVWAIGVNSLAWWCGYQATLALAAENPARSAYAFLSGWGLALYLGYVLGAHSARSIVLTALGTAAASLAAAASGHPFFGDHDLDRTMPQQVLFVALAQAAVVASPVVVNTLVSWLVVRIAALPARLSRG